MPAQIFSNTKEPQSVSNVPVQAEPVQVIESELAGASIPRVARLTQSSITTRRVLWNALFVAIGLLGFFWRRDYETWNALIARGITTNATVYNKYTRSGKSTSYYVEYQFNTGSGVIEDRNSVSSGSYNNTYIGARFPVTYLPEPTVTKWQLFGATPERRDDQSRCWLGAGIAVAACFGITIAAVINHAKSHLRYLQEGIAIVGKVTSGEVIRGKYTTYRLHYAYLPGNVRYTGIADVDASRYKAMTTGTPYFTLLYDSAAPSKSIPYFQVTQAYLVAAAS